MKSILAVSLLAALVAAEVPSHSYLPPPPRAYSQTSTPVIALARSLETDHQNSDHHSSDHHNPDQNGEHHGDASVTGFARSSEQEYTPYGVLSSQARPNNDEQGYDTNAAGFARNALEDVNSTVSYEAEEHPFKSSTEESEKNPPGYDSNPNNFRSNDGNHGNEQNGSHSSNGYN